MIVLLILIIALLLKFEVKSEKSQIHTTRVPGTRVPGTLELGFSLRSDVIRERLL